MGNFSIWDLRLISSESTLAHDILFTEPSVLQGLIYKTPNKTHKLDREWLWIITGVQSDKLRKVFVGKFSDFCSFSATFWWGINFLIFLVLFVNFVFLPQYIGLIEVRMCQTLSSIDCELSKNFYFPEHSQRGASDSAFRLSCAK